MRWMLKYIPSFLLMTISLTIQAHPGGLDSNGGHNNKKTSQYHCHRQSCSDDLEKAQLASTPHSNTYNRKDWPHWIDEDGDCQNTRAEILIASSLEPVKFKRNKGCVVAHGKWLDPYTKETFVKASDLDIDHIVPLAYAHRHGAVGWTREQKRLFANDPENLMAVDDNTNQAKGDKGPERWMPPHKEYWCTYATKWTHIISKYELNKNKALLGVNRSRLSINQYCH